MKTQTFRKVTIDAGNGNKREDYLASSVIKGIETSNEETETEKKKEIEHNKTRLGILEIHAGEYIQEETEGENGNKVFAFVKAPKTPKDDEPKK